MSDDEDSSSSSDITLTDSDSENCAEDVEAEDIENDETVEDVEEEEDEVIKAIKKENQRQSDHPPTIQCEDFITDISFHPSDDMIAVALITGDVALYKYANEENTLLENLELHTKACRDVEFNSSGSTLFSVAKDKTIMLSDVETRKLIRFYEEAHSCPIYCISVLNDNVFATGMCNVYLLLHLSTLKKLLILLCINITID